MTVRVLFFLALTACNFRWLSARQEDVPLDCGGFSCDGYCETDVMCPPDQLCINNTCTVKTLEMYPQIAFSPSGRMQIWTGLPSPEMYMAVKPGVYDTEPVMLMITKSDSIAVQDGVARVLDTNISGTFSINVTAIGRAGASSATGTFVVRPDEIYAYTERIGVVDAMTAIYSDGSGAYEVEWDTTDKHDTPSIEGGADYGWVTPRGRPVYVLTDELLRRFSVRQGGGANTSRELLRTTDSLTFSGVKRATCRLGDERSAPVNARDADNCAYAPHALSASDDGRFVALHIAKITALSECKPHDYFCTFLQLVLSGGYRALTNLQMHVTPGPVIIIDTQALADTLDVTTQTPAFAGYQVLGQIPENDGRDVPSTQYIDPALSADGSTLYVTRLQQPACPVGGCASGEICGSAGSCVAKACLRSNECGDNSVCLACDVVSAGTECPTGTVAGSGRWVFGPSGTTGGTGYAYECCDAGGNFCSTPCETDAACAEGQKCALGFDDAACYWPASTDLVLLDRETLAEKRAVPAARADNVFFVHYPLMSPVMVGNERVAYLTVPDITASAFLASGVTGYTGPTASTSFGITASLSATGFVGEPILLAPRSSGEIIEANLFQMNALRSFSSGFDKVNSCLTGATGFTGAQICITDCVDTLDNTLEQISELGQDFTVWCTTEVSQGHLSFRSSSVSSLSANGAGDKIAIIAGGYRYLMETAGDCATAALKRRFCGDPALAIGPTNAHGGAYSTLLLYDVASDVSSEPMSGDAFAPFLLDAGANVNVRAAQFIADGKQLAFFAEGPAVGGTGTLLFVMNTDGSNMRKMGIALRKVGSVQDGCSCHESSSGWIVMLLVAAFALRRSRA